MLKVIVLQGYLKMGSILDRDLCGFNGLKWFWFEVIVEMIVK